MEEKKTGEDRLPVAIIGAGPVGLAAAAHLIARGEEPLVLEAGSRVGSSLREWGHVRLFSPWRYVVDSASAELLAAAGWESPDDGEHPTGNELVDRYLEPLAAIPTLRDRIRLGTRVESVSRQGYDKMKTAGRERAPFALQVRGAGGREEVILARAVIDASGTWQRPNPLGSGGVPAAGERALAARIFYGIPDALGAHRARYAGRRTAVVGSGHSAFNALLDLIALGEEAPGTEITWVIRRPTLDGLFGGGDRDALAARGRLGDRVRGLVESGRLRVAAGFKVTELRAGEEGVILIGEGNALPPVDEVVAATGFRPDLSLASELRLSLDPAVESPVALAPLIDPNVHSCGTVRPHGAEELKQPEEGFFIVGMKSYGRAPTFLLHRLRAGALGGGRPRRGLAGGPRGPPRAAGDRGLLPGAAGQGRRNRRRLLPVELLRVSHGLTSRMSGEVDKSRNAEAGPRRPAIRIARHGWGALGHLGCP